MEIIELINAHIDQIDKLAWCLLAIGILLQWVCTHIDIDEIAIMLFIISIICIFLALFGFITSLSYQISQSALADMTMDSVSNLRDRIQAITDNK